MTAPIWMAAPPEVHSALLSSGPGPGSLLMAAGAWSSLSTEYTETAEELTALLGAVQAGAWEGPTAEEYVAAHAPYLAWLTQASTDAAATAAQHEIAATAYTTALAAMPTVGELAANHATHAVLLATNFFGINTIPIALNETDYVRMWIQAATVMSTYQGVTTAAVAASPQTSPAPQIVKSNAQSASASWPPDREQQWLAWLQKIGYVNFYNNVLQPLINDVMNNPFIQALFSLIDPYLPELGNPLIFLDPTNIAFALGYPMDIGSYVAYLAETFAYIGLDLSAAWATGNPYAIGLTIVFDTVEAIGTIITDTIALLKTLLEQTLVLIPTLLPLLTVPLAPLAVVPLAASGLAGLAGLAGLYGIPAIPIAPFPPPVAFALAPTPTPVPVPPPAPVLAPAAAAATAPVAPGAPPPTPAAPPGVVTAEGFAYMVGDLTAVARKAASVSAKAKALEPVAAAIPAASAGPETPDQSRRRRRTKVEMLGRGYEYMDLEPEPMVVPSDRGAGPLGFAGTASKQIATAAAGLTTLADNEFGGGPRMPMMPGTWGTDSAPDDDT
jgi:PPE-repeat protein